MRSNLFTSLLTLIPVLGDLALGYEVQTPPLDTDWTYTVGTDPWPEYPRPQLQRDEWQSLNGIWKWKSASYPGEPVPAKGSFDEDILVPSCIESAISGVMKMNQTYSWYRTEFTVPQDYIQKGKRVLLNFEAVDHQATVYVNGDLVGIHVGGYWHFNFDVTKYLNTNGTNTLHVFVFDPTDAEGYMNPVGKQTRVPSHIFYTPCTGIWQTVWLESVPDTYIQQLDIIAEMDGTVNVTVTTNQGTDSVSVSILDGEGASVASVNSGTANKAFDFKVSSPKLWSPDSPTLYNLTVTVGEDTVNSYTGFRTLSTGEIDGVTRPLLNGEFIFQFGTLDQGFWPDGIYTPPNREAMVYDLKMLKDLGLNMLRKHIKVENALFYRACDELGLLLIQDMPSMPLRTPDADQQAEWERQLDILIQQHKNYPSIYTWVIYNEGWGQITDYYPEFNLTARVKQLDPTRFVDSTTGWHDHGAGDFHDNHHYANPQCGTPFYSIQSTPYDNKRIAIQGEFGGIGHNVSAEHLWKVELAVQQINQTYEIDADLDAYNYRGHLLLSELRDQVEKYACSGAVWTQTTDVEGEVNGFLTYDRRLQRTDKKQWRADIQALYDAAASRGGKATNATTRKFRL
ncbi:glycoside hydrolase family 2 protein [Hypoxylon rubiginosum]|uniref:Glycoside hydrolase family 2 protein n=1 Tax=Hypoxylon rubiginosum TaxID=110542 RepID=A0ACC0D2E8_9PEZI|nr:glycoside hydrolase family 2 protein [Hypoxylon rubiginosum]